MKSVITEDNINRSALKSRLPLQLTIQRNSALEYGLQDDRQTDTDSLGLSLCFSLSSLQKSIQNPLILVTYSEQRFSYWERGEKTSLTTRTWWELFQLNPAYTLSK